MISLWDAFWSSAQVILFCLVCLWLLSLAIRNVHHIDSFWGLGFVIITAYCYNIVGDSSTRKLVALITVGIWGIRLCLYLLYRNWGQPEDYRYQHIRKSFGPSYWLTSFLIVYGLQGTLMMIISLPLINIMTNQTSESGLTLLDGVGIVLWIIGFYFEVVGDYELTKFKSNPENKGKLLNTGVWSKTRHPNYFGDACQWWGFFVVNLSLPNGLYFIFSPILMTFLLLRVSGVSLLERTLSKKKPGYDQYMKTTPAFIPKIF